MNKSSFQAIVFFLFTTAAIRLFMNYLQERADRLDAMTADAQAYLAYIRQARQDLLMAGIQPPVSPPVAMMPLVGGAATMAALHNNIKQPNTNNAIIYKQPATLRTITSLYPPGGWSSI